jgi:hypothetical protein
MTEVEVSNALLYGGLALRVVALRAAQQELETEQD